jgi:hypothetical protein
LAAFPSVEQQKQEFPSVSQYYPSPAGKLQGKTFKIQTAMFYTKTNRFVAFLSGCALLLNSCSKKDVPPPPPPSSTDLKIVVSDPGGARVANAGVWLYNTQSDWTYSTNPIKHLTTDANGEVLFTKLSPVRYWYSVKIGCMNNNNTAHAVSTSLPSGKTTTAATILQQTGTLRFVNRSSNPYRIYINGVQVIDQNGGSTLDLQLEPAEPKTIRVLQLSGYAVSPTEKTYTGTLSCGGLLTTTYP